MTRSLRAVAAAAIALCAAPAAAQEPAASSGTTFAITGARIVTLAGPVIDRGTIVMRDGRIVAVGPDVSPPEGATVVDGTGLHVYPGFFDSASQLGLTEIGSVAATNDFAEAGDMNPQVVAIAAVHPSSDHLPVARANGITHAIALPARLGGGGGGAAPAIIGGQASAFSLAGWTVEEMVMAPSVGTVVVWPTLATRGFDPATFSPRQRPFDEVKQEYEKKVASLEAILDASRRYREAAGGQAASGVRDLKLEALGPVVSGARPLLVYANAERDIRNALAFTAREGVSMVLLGGDESWRLARELAARAVPVILGPTQALPVRADDPYDTPYARAGMLREAGVEVAIASFNSADSRNLPYEAGHAVGYGLAWEDALRAITIVPAEILGLAGEVGTIEPNKRANLVVTDGDPLEIRTAVMHVFVNGVPQSLSTRHTRLYETYRARE